MSTNKNTEPDQLVDAEQKNVHPLLLAKLRALHSVFFEQWRQVPLYRFPTFSSFQTPPQD